MALAFSVVPLRGCVRAGPRGPGTQGAGQRAGPRCCGRGGGRAVRCAAKQAFSEIAIERSKVAISRGSTPLNDCLAQPGPLPAACGGSGGVPVAAARGHAPAAQQGKSAAFWRAGQGWASVAAQPSRPRPFPSPRRLFFKPSAGGRLRGKAPACAGVSRRARRSGGIPPGLLALPGQRAARRRGRSRGCGPRPPMPRWVAPQWGAVCAARPAASGAQKSAPSPGALSYSISSRASSSVMPSPTTRTAAPPASSSAPAIGGLP